MKKIIIFLFAASLLYGAELSELEKYLCESQYQIKFSKEKIREVEQEYRRTGYTDKNKLRFNKYQILSWESHQEKFLAEYKQENGKNFDWNICKDYEPMTK